MFLLTGFESLLVFVIVFRPLLQLSLYVELSFSLDFTSKVASFF